MAEALDELRGRLDAEGWLPVGHGAGGGPTATCAHTFPGRPTTKGRPATSRPSPEPRTQLRKGPGVARPFTRPDGSNVTA